MKRIVFVLLTVLWLSACKEEHFISDSGYRQMVEDDFLRKKELFGESGAALFAVFDEEMTLAEREALTFLYAYSPLLDISCPGGDYLLDNVRLAFRAREEMPWGKTVPEDIFRHFVLPVRGGKEDLDTARAVFYRELEDRVAACETLERAALEVNHWCHEHVIYKPTNARTSSPLATMARAYGRCGEESVFTLAALRAVGIPARQIYTPRWAHCDDNHAWIEVWIDGTWKYLGACEPEPRLNIAWFTLPVQRAMYVEAEVFGKYTGGAPFTYEAGILKIGRGDDGCEEIVTVGENMTTVNVTSHYTDTGKQGATGGKHKRTIVRVVDEHQQPVSGARVEYKIFNYGEYYPVVTLHSDAHGETALTLALGDLFVWASRGDRVGFARFPVAEIDTLVLSLDKREGESFSGAFDLIPPVQRDIEALTTAGERAVNDRRFMHEDSLRNAYEATFMSAARARDVALELGVDTARFARHVVAACGNYRAIEELCRRAGDKRLALSLLDVVAEKDLQDTPAEVWLDHLRWTAFEGDSMLYREYVLNPRVRNELITPYRGAIREAYGERVRAVERNNPAGIPGELVRIVGEIRLTDIPAKVATPPIGVLRAGVTDALSRDIFFVAVCRSFGLPARLNPISGKPEYRNGEEWHPVDFEAERVTPKGSLMLHYVGAPVGNPRYFLHFTIGKIKDGSVRTIDLGSNAAVDMGAGATYSSIFATPVELEEGNYILSTGNRRSDGGVLATLTTFRVEAGRQTDMLMDIRPCEEVTEVVGRVALPLSFVPESGTGKGQVKFPKTGYTAVAIVEADKEPTNHLLRDMGSLKTEFEQLGVPLYFIFRDQRNLQKFNRADFRPFPGSIIWGHDREDSLLQSLSADLNLGQAVQFPLVILLNAGGEVVFVSRGYRVGLGTQVLNVMSRE